MKKIEIYLIQKKKNNWFSSPIVFTRVGSFLFLFFLSLTKFVIIKCMKMTFCDGECLKSFEL